MKTASKLASVKDQLANLANQFGNFRDNTHQSYKDLDEAQTRLSYIDKFWRILGWQVDSTAEVQIETRVGTKKPDYRFLHNATTVFFVEAKKPIEKLTNTNHIFQAKSYGWNANVPLVILMDFEEFRPFRTRTQPKFDKPEQGLLKKLDMFYTDYADRADDLLNTFGREAVLGGSLADMMKFSTTERNATVDKEFLKTLADWRERLASNIALRNTFDSDFELAEAVQRILDRLVFLRILEDREIESEQHIENLSLRGVEDIYPAFIKVSKKLAPKYNGLLFNPHPLSENLVIDDKVLRPILKELHHNESPYRFDVIPVDVLGTIYERFLGDEIRLTDSGRAKVETKPEVRKAGGVYYTPQYIVEYIVQNTVGKLLEKCKTPDDVSKLRICDPACGSGSFLLGAFDALIRWHEEWFQKAKNPVKDWMITLQPAKGRKKAVTIPLAFKTSEGSVRLTAFAKGRIVQNCLYGVDLDRQATEVAQMSLYIKVLEHLGEEQRAIAQMLDFKEALLPTLSKNIKCGNSLIGSDFSNDDLFGLSDKEQRKINPFDWQHQFPFLKQTGGFDAVIGNPPYVRPHNIEDSLKPYLWSHYKTFVQKADLYTCFMELGVQLVRKDGYFGNITSNSWLRLDSFEKSRAYLLANTIIKIVIDFAYHVFDSASVLTNILVLQRQQVGKEPPSIKVAELTTEVAMADISFKEIQQSRFEESYKKVFDLSQTDESDKIKKKMFNNAKPVQQQYNLSFGLKTGDDSKFLSFQPASNEHRKLLRGANIHRYSHNFEGEYVWYVPEQMRQHRKTARPGEQGRFETPKVLIRDTGGNLECTFDDEHYYVKDVIIVTHQSANRDNLLFLAGILNSKLMRFYYETTFPTLHVQRDEIASLPIRILEQTDKSDIDLYGKLTALVQTMLDTQSKLKTARTDFEREQLAQSVSRIDREIDALVYRLYGLTAEEVRIVESGA